MKILFVGALDFSRHCLERVLQMGGDVCGVITLSEKRARFNSDYVDLRPVATRHGVPVYQVRKIGDPDAVDLVRSLSPDVMFVFGWSQLVPTEVLSIPPMGCVGTHPALLPKNRGRHPIIWSLVKGFDRSGLTFFYLEEGADSGDILWQRPFDITLEDDAGTLYGKIKALATDAIAEFLPQLQNGEAPRTPQDHSQATYLRKRNEKDGEIVWADTSRNIYNLIRGLTRPYPGAHTFLEESKVTIWQSRLADADAVDTIGRRAPGTTVCSNDGGVYVATADGYLQIIEYEESCKNALRGGVILG